MTTDREQATGAALLGELLLDRVRLFRRVDAARGEANASIERLLSCCRARADVEVIRGAKDDALAAYGRQMDLIIDGEVLDRRLKEAQRRG